MSAPLLLYLCPDEATKALLEYVMSMLRKVQLKRRISRYGGLERGL